MIAILRVGWAFRIVATSCAISSHDTTPELQREAYFSSFTEFTSSF